MIRRLFVFAAPVLFALPLVAQAPDPARVASARRLMEANGAAELMVTMMKSNIPVQRQAMPQIPAEFWDRFEQRMVAEAPQFLDSIVVLYANTFTVSELQQMVTFYESPIGRRLRESQADLVNQSTAIGQRWGARIGSEVAAGMQH